MEYLKQRQKTRRWLYSKITTIGLLLLLAILIRPTWKIFEKSRLSRDNLSQARNELAELENRKQELESNISYIRSDHGRDQEIRDKFGVAKQDETMVVIVRDKEVPSSVEAPEKPSLVKRVWSGFLSIFGI